MFRQDDGHGGVVRSAWMAALAILAFFAFWLGITALVMAGW